MDLEGRLRKVESRITFIEKFLGENVITTPKGKQEAPVVPTALITPATPVASQPAQESKTQTANYQVPNYKTPDSGEKSTIHFVDNNAFNRKLLSNNTNSLLFPVAIIGFLLVSFFMLRFAVDTGWLSPVKQVFIGSLMGILLIGAGFFYKDLDNEYIRYLPSGGIALLFLAAFGSSNFYHFLPHNSAFLLIGILGVGCLLMYQEFKHQIYLIVAAAGSYIIPLYVANESNLTLANLYFLIITAIFAGVAFWLNLRPVFLLAGYLALPISTIAEYNDNSPGQKVFFVSAHFLILSAGFALVSLRNKQLLTKIEMLAIGPLIVLYYVIGYYNVEQIHQYFGPAIIFITSLYLGLIYLKLKKPVEPAAAIDQDEIKIVQS